ncbi:oxidoreductase fad-binding domain-containing protein [Ophiostoma piceae UAMH 11346]|uniref:Oxidoreductase fad-binding domain-containing protein n=1 Tax=Ophiostoma piceae (strain UAMH 11346) TaxID=1262450 RepID=S3BM48_OPHP1|nr:oxidoreductase fad-binding domain-containing protein [Ophiostoma piceae UAMH 11346]
MRPSLRVSRLGSPATSLASVIPCCRTSHLCRLPRRLQSRVELAAPPARPPARRHFTSSRQRCADNTESEAPSQRPPKSRRGLWVVSTLLLVAGAYWTASDSSSHDQVHDDGSSNHRTGSSLNQETFVPFQVVARETVSPTAFVLTLRLPRVATPESRAATRQLINKAWQHGLWSIEVKQPQLQIARDYTPLPDVGDANVKSSDNDDVEIRIFVRTVPGGEVSRYLSQRVVGSTIDVRGPRLSFDVSSRLASREGSDAAPMGPAGQKQVVILAGGTGIATALQAAASVLSTSPSTSTIPVAILWANRLAQDTVGLEGGDASLANPVVRDLRALQAQYGADRVRVLSYVDAQRTFIQDSDVHKFVSGPGDHRGWGVSVWPFGSSTTPVAAPSPPPSASAMASAQPCVYHSKKTLERLESDPEYGSARACCLCKNASGRTPASPPGSSLILVSGPDGFVSAWAGPKTWAAGLERQGPVGGILRKMAAKDPKLAEWQVLKL